jgi:hypothetical protein
VAILRNPSVRPHPGPLPLGEGTAVGNLDYIQVAEQRSIVAWPEAGSVFPSPSGKGWGENSPKGNFTLGTLESAQRSAAVPGGEFRRRLAASFFRRAGRPANPPAGRRPYEVHGKGERRPLPAAIRSSEGRRAGCFSGRRGQVMLLPASSGQWPDDTGGSPVPPIPMVAAGFRRVQRRISTNDRNYVIEQIFIRAAASTPSPRPNGERAGVRGILFESDLASSPRPSPPSGEEREKIMQRHKPTNDWKLRLSDVCFG